MSPRPIARAAARQRAAGRSGGRGLLGREAAEGVRLVALDLLAQARAAAARLPDRSDAEALHDFRVAVRRLRSWLRSFRSEVEDTLRGRWRRQLGALAASTGAARDAEVTRAILEGERAALLPRHRRAVDWLAERAAPARPGEPDARERAARELERLAPHLSHGLSRYQRGVGARRVGRFGAAAARALRGQAEALFRALAAVEGPDDVERAHRARIEGKRLRYLLEPLRQVTPAAHAAVRSMKALQDALGDLHDRHVLAARIADGLAEAAAEGARAEHRALHAAGEGQARAVARRNPRLGLLALDRRIREGRDALHAELRRSWLGGGEGAERLAREVEAVARDLTRRRGRPRARARSRRAQGGARAPHTPRTSRR